MANDADRGRLERRPNQTLSPDSALGGRHCSRGNAYGTAMIVRKGESGNSPCRGRQAGGNPVGGEGLAIRAIAFKFAFAPQLSVLNRNDAAHSAEHLAIGSSEPAVAILCEATTQFTIRYCRTTARIYASQCPNYNATALVWLSHHLTGHYLLITRGCGQDALPGQRHPSHANHRFVLSDRLLAAIVLLMGRHG